MKTETNTTIILTLNNDEITWLKALMQNPLPQSQEMPVAPSAESDINYTYRKAFWVALGGD